MRHLESDGLLRVVRGEAGASLVRHVEQCARCASRVESLRTARAGLLAVSGAPLDAGPDCLDEITVAAFVDGGLSSSERERSIEHVAGCTRCRTAVSSVARAGALLGVAREIQPEGGSRWGWIPYAAPLAAAAVVAFLVLVSESPPPEMPTHRQGSVVSGPAPVAISPIGPTTSVRTLRWHAVDGADRYRVTVFDADGVVLFETTSSDTVVALPADVQIVAGQPHYWIVAARTGFDRWDTSALGEFSTPEGLR